MTAAAYTPAPYSPNVVPFRSRRARFNTIEQEELAHYTIESFNKLAGNRGNWESHWEDLARYFYPAHSQSFSAFNPQRAGGEKRTDYILDSKPVTALKKCVAIMSWLLTPPNAYWHRIVSSDPDLMKDRDVALWFEDTNRRLFKYRGAPSANFSANNYQFLASLVGLGTGAMIVDSAWLGGRFGYRYKCSHMGQTFPEENHQGSVDRVHRSFRWSARQMYRQWGENLPTKILEAANKGSEERFTIIHCVKPREDLDARRKDYAGMKYLSYYVSLEGKQVLSEGGYSSFPVIVSRFDQTPDEVYGRGPTMDVLPAVKTLMEHQRAFLRQAHRTTDPVLLFHNDGIMSRFNGKPGSFNSGAMTSEGRSLVGTLPVGSLSAGEELINVLHGQIDEALFVNLYKLAEETKEMTRFEVMERLQEKATLLAPMVGRQQAEYQGPLIERELDIGIHNNLFLPMPPALIDAKGEYRVEFETPLARTQRADEGSGAMNFIEFLKGQVEINPEAMDVWNADEANRDMAKTQWAVPERYLRSKDEIAEMRQGRAQQQQAQTQIQAAPAAAAMLKASAAVAGNGKPPAPK